MRCKVHRRPVPPTSDEDEAFPGLNDSKSVLTGVASSENSEIVLSAALTVTEPFCRLCPYWISTGQLAPS